MDVLRAIHVPCFDGEYDGSFDSARILRVLQTFEQFRVVFGDTSRSPQFDASAVGVVHQENERLRIVGS